MDIKLYSSIKTLVNYMICRNIVSDKDVNIDIRYTIYRKKER